MLHVLHILSPKQFNVEDNQEELEINGTCKLVVCADFHTLGENVNIIKKTQQLLDAGKEIGPEVNTVDEDV